MAAVNELIDQVRVPHGRSIRLKDYDPAWAGDPALPKAERKRLAEEVLTQDVSALAEAQDRLYAANRWSILLILQAMDAAGKDSTIKHVMSGVNPQGCEVTSFKHPSAEELDHNFLWRYARALPERGRIGIFNRSYYEEVLVVRVHPELVKAEHIPDGRIDDDFWADRYDDINAFERHLTRNGTVILKFFLHISRDEQRKRFLKRLEGPEETLEVLARRPGRARLLGRLHEGLRGRSQRDQHEVGPLVHHSRPITSGSPAAWWRGSSPRPSSARPPLPRGKP